MLIGREGGRIALMWVLPALGRAGPRFPGGRGGRDFRWRRHGDQPGQVDWRSHRRDQAHRIA